MLRTKNRILRSLPAFLVFLPVFIALVWHINNRAWPSDDAANYMTTAYQQYRVLQTGSLLDFIRSLYEIRGWRPTIFPVLATPFLWLFNGNILASAACVLILSFLVWQIYAYYIARRFLDPIRAAVVASFVGSSTAVASQSLVFFSEIVWLALFGGFVFHVLESQESQSPYHAAISGIYLGLSTTIRPAETFAILIFPFLIFIGIAIAHKRIGARTAISTIVLICSMSALLLSAAFFPAVNYRVLFPVGTIFLVVFSWFTTRHDKIEPSAKSLKLMIVWSLVINLLWWANSMPALYSWVYITSFGSMAKITTKSAPISIVVERVLLYYLYPQGIILAVIVLSIFLNNFYKNILLSRSLLFFGIISLSLLFPMLILYGITGTNDLRRVFIGMTFLMLFLSIFSLQEGGFRIIRDICVTTLLSLQLIGFLWTSKGIPPPFPKLHWISTGVSFPKETIDQNVALIKKLLTLGVPRNSAVAVYTEALFYAQDRIYEPAALTLASTTMDANLHIVYFWDIGGYSPVIRRLQADGVRYLLIDKYQDPGQEGSYQPSWQFASSLLGKIASNKTDPPNLRRISSFMLAGREQILFRITPGKTLLRPVQGQIPGWVE